VLKSQHSLEYHVKSHDVGRQHPCTTCGKRFVTRTKLRMHANIHSGQKPYQVRPDIVICNVKIRILTKISVPNPDPHVLDLPNPDPLVRGMDPDPEPLVRGMVRILLASSKNSKKNLDYYCFVTSFGLFIFEK
jgi:hypothetical protein